jgi:hypothetical protein
MTSHYSEVYQKYGKIISEYYGCGEITFENSEKYSCEFCVFQLSDGDTYFAIEKLPLGTTYSIKDMDRKFSFKGITDSGLYVTIQLNDVFILKRIFLPLVYRIRRFKIVKMNANKIKRIKFCITNFLFEGNNASRDTLSLNLNGWTPICIQKVDDYSEKETRLKNKDFIDITSELFISLNNSSEISGAVELAHEICCLLSICRGSKLTWINYTIYDEKEEMMHQVCCSLSTRPLSELPELISSESRGINSTKKFIETGYLTVSKDPYLNKSLLKFCNVFTEARDGRGYTELRSVRISVLMEMLKEYILENPDFEISREILDKTKQKRVIGQILKQCKEVISEQIDSLEDIEYIEEIKFASRWNLPSTELIENHNEKLDEIRLDFYSNLAGLNRAIFKKIITRFCEELGVPVTPYEITQFVKSRNSLIHTGNFFCKSQKSNVDNATWKEYQFLVYFLDKVFLKLFGYSGKYDNFMKWGDFLEDFI